MELIIVSKKYGKFIVYYDECDSELVSKYNWYIRMFPTRKYAVTNIWHKERKSSSLVGMHQVIMGMNNVLGSI